MVVVWIVMGIAAMACAAGGLVWARSPKHPSHVTFAVGMALVALDALVSTAGASGVVGDGPGDWQRLRLLIASLLPAPWVAFSRMYARGDYLLAWRRWKRSWLVLAFVPPGMVLAGWRTGLVSESALPTGEVAVVLGPVGVAIEILLLLSSVGVLTQFERTFRESVGVMRWRIKYVLIGLGVLFGFQLYASSQALLFSAPLSVLGPGAGAALLVGVACLSLGLRRDRVFAVDLYPSHALLYHSVTVLLAGAYLLVVGLLSRAMVGLGSPGGLALRAFWILGALSGLGALLMSERLRQRLRTFVSRHFNRPSYDYRVIWRTFATETSALVDEGVYCRAVASWTSSTFQTLAASLWLIEESGDRLRLGGSTILPDSAADGFLLAATEVRGVVAALSKAGGLLDLEAAKETWAESLRRIHPSTFPQGGCRAVLPLKARGRVLGLIILGDRVGGMPFTEEDGELLACVGEQIAASLLGMRLAAQVLRAKEMEAFQAMSTFFVHDLKNTVSTLSLTLQNLDQHFGNPDFRDDALRAVRKGVERLNDLIARLGRLRQGLQVNLVPTPLRDVVETAVATFGAAKVSEWMEIEAELPPLLLDGEQLQRVFVNLLLNALDAGGPSEAIRIRIASVAGWAVVEVRDRGAGMTPEFLRNSLFKPFQTTKTKGLGIGMFHSKTIVEAHGGRMEVQSELRVGTTVGVWLPLPTSP